MTKQVRFIPTGDCGLRVREAGEGQEQSRTVEGTPIVFGVRSVNLTPWSDTREVYEILEPGCISEELLRSSDVILNINHSTKVTDVLGRCRDNKGTLMLTLNPRNVESSCDLPNTSVANDTLELIRRGDISGMSFAFEDDWEDTENGVSYERTNEKSASGKEVWIRHVKRIIGLYDVSIVTHPAYEQTSVAAREAGDAMMRSIDQQIAAQGETEEERKAREAAEAKAKAAQEEKERQEREAKEEQERKEREAAAVAARVRRLREYRRRIEEDMI